MPKHRTFSSEGCADAMVAAAYEDEAEAMQSIDYPEQMRRDQAEITRLRAALREIDTFAWSAVRCDYGEATSELQRRVDVCRAALKQPHD